ncbi:hypothetical protein MMC20_004001 [Loxospora ochrophaea]|nr:hypothetical protein [Loxospora ochrophaea]
MAPSKPRSSLKSSLRNLLCGSAGSSTLGSPPGADSETFLQRSNRHVTFRLPEISRLSSLSDFSLGQDIFQSWDKEPALSCRQNYGLPKPTTTRPSPLTMKKLGSLENQLHEQHQLRKVKGRPERSNPTSKPEDTKHHRNTCHGSPSRLDAAVSSQPARSQVPKDRPGPQSSNHYGAILKILRFGDPGTDSDSSQIGGCSAHEIMKQPQLSLQSVCLLNVTDQGHEISSVSCDLFSTPDLNLYQHFRLETANGEDHSTQTNNERSPGVMECLFIGSLLELSTKTTNSRFVARLDIEQLEGCSEERSPDADDLWLSLAHDTTREGQTEERNWQDPPPESSTPNSRQFLHAEIVPLPHEKYFLIRESTLYRHEFDITHISPNLDCGGTMRRQTVRETFPEYANYIHNSLSSRKSFTFLVAQEDNQVAESVLCVPLLGHEVDSWLCFIVYYHPS